MISNKEILLEIAFYEALRKQYKRKARHHPHGDIYFKYEHGKYRPYMKDNGKMIYLGTKKRNTTSRLINKKIENSISQCIENNLIVLKRMNAEFKGSEWIFGNKVMGEFEERMGKGFKISDYLCGDEKKNHPQELTFHKESSSHITPAGVVVRSKAELVIATFLEMKGIEYTYEKPLKLIFRTVAPDFTIKRKSDGKIIVWEHFGMMDDPEYYESRLDLLSDYHHAGWLPYDNFIATFGEQGTPMDMTFLETICETMLR